MNFRIKHIETVLKELVGHIRRPLAIPLPLESVQCDGYKTGNTPPTEGWEPAQSGQLYQGKDAHFWIRSRFTTPELSHPDRYFVLSVTTGKEGQWDATNPQGLLYLNGDMVQGLDTNHTYTIVQPSTEYQMHLYFYLGLIQEAIPCRIFFGEADRRVEQLHYDLQVALESCLLLKENDDDFLRISHLLERCVDMLDLREPYSDRFFDSIAAATEFIQKELYDNLCTTEGKPVVNCIGHTHIDVEWLWTRFQTKEKIQRSAATVLTLMEEYPEYKFMLSQPELYRYLKEEAPEVYQKLKARVEEGRWEPEGAMFVEADCNLISGESFVRQILHGKRFFKEEFGVDCKVLFLPDVFGYSAALPQILTKSGIRHFVTSKISWNDTNTMPVDTFLWEGIDGTEIFTNFITAQNYVDPATNFTTYNGLLTPSQIKGTWHRHSQRDYVNSALTTVGHGDGGGGPTRAMLERYRRLQRGLPGMPVAKMEFLLPYLDQCRAEFDENCKKLKKTPRWVGELYLEFHRGTYTSMSKNKKANRKSEFALKMVELLSMTDLLQGGSYDAKGLQEHWLTVLHNQFHDIIPGSSIKEVYDLTDQDYARILGYCDQAVTSKLEAIAGKVKTQGGLLVYNPLGFARKGTVKVQGKTLEIPEEIPAFGWNVIPLPQEKNQVKVTGLTAENDHYVMTLSQDGTIESLYDKKADRSVFLPGQKGNQLQIFEDFPHQWDNWELSPYYKQKMWTVDTAEIVPITDGDRAGFRVKKTYMNSTFCQNIWLYSQGRRIDFETEIDWHEHHQVLKLAFPLDVHATSATYEIQYGHVNRPTHENTSWDKAKFEVYGHKWVDMSENGYGVALLNDCKYGHNTEGSTLKLTLLKCGTYPNPEADQGLHQITYSLFPHEGDLVSAGVVQEAYSLNQPLTALEVGSQEGSQPETFSLVSIDRDHIILDAVKKAEDSEDMILRLYESGDRRAKATLTVAEGFREVYLCDLMENPIEKLDFDGKTCTLPVSNFEIITLKFVR